MGGDIGTLHIHAVDSTVGIPVIPVNSARSGMRELIGRQSDIEELINIFAIGERSTTPTIALIGVAGVGKSELAGAVSKTATASGKFRYTGYADMQGYITEGGKSVMPDQLYLSLCHILEVKGIAKANTPSAQGVLFHRRMAELDATGEAVLLWLDNVADLRQVEALIPANGIHRVLLTTRETFSPTSGVHNYTVDLLDSEESVAMLVSTVGSGDVRMRSESADLSMIASLCGHLPLAIAIVGAILATQPMYAISDMIEDLQGERDRLNVMNYDGEWSVRAAFGLSYARLSSDLSELFRLLALIPAGSLGLRSAVAILNESPPTTRARLLQLERAHLIEQQTRNRWRFHDLLRIYSAELLTQANDDTQGAYGRLVKQYLADSAAATEFLCRVPSDKARQTFDSIHDAAEWFDAERPALVTVALHADDWPEHRFEAAQLGALIGDLLGRGLYYDERIATADIAISVAADAGHTKLQALGCISRGIALRELGRSDEALDAQEHAAQLALECGDGRMNRNALFNIANIALGRGDFSRAIEAYESDVALGKAEGDTHGVVITQLNLGAALSQTGRAETALSVIKEACATCIEHKYELDHARALGMMGLAYHADGKPNLAIPQIRKATEIFQQRGDYHLEAGLRCNLGTIQMEIGDLDGAIEDYQRSIRLYRESGAPQDKIEPVAASFADALHGKSESLTADSIDARDVEILREGISILLETNQALGAAKICFRLGTLLERADIEAARIEYYRAHAIFLEARENEYADYVKRRIDRLDP